MVDENADDIRSIVGKVKHVNYPFELDFVIEVNTKTGEEVDIFFWHPYKKRWVTSLESVIDDIPPSEKDFFHFCEEVRSVDFSFVLRDGHLILKEDSEDVEFLSCRMAEFVTGKEIMDEKRDIPTA